MMFVCIDCRTSRRYIGWNLNRPKCQFCSASMFYAYHKFEMPKKNDIKGWKKFEEMIIGFNRDIANRNIAGYKAKIDRLKSKLDRLHNNNTKRIVELESEIAGLLYLVKLWDGYWRRNHG